MAGMTIELSDYVIDAIAEAVVKKMQEPKTDNRVKTELNGVKTELAQEPGADILDKIRAEIETEKIGYPPSADYYKAIMKVLQIIDKYRQEG